MDEAQSPKDNRSRRHHFLPRHYLRGFANGQNLFYVYDKQKDQVLPKPLTPDSMFFENDLNTVTLPSGQQSDFLEELYTEVENSIWDSFDSIRSSEHNQVVKLLDKMNLFFFLLFLHWRLPSNANHLQRLSRQLFKAGGELPFFKLEDMLGNDAPEEAKSALRGFRDIDKVARLVAPFAPFHEQNWSDRLQNWRFLYTGDGGNWLCVGDNPIITKGVNDHDPKKCLDEFIFPVAGNVLLAATSRPVGSEFSPDFIMQFNSAVVQRSSRFVASSRKDFLEASIEDYRIHKRFDKEGHIIAALFGILDE